MGTTLMSGSMISGGLARATLEELYDPASIPRVKTGQNLRIIGQVLFLCAIIAGYAALVYVIRRAGARGAARQPLWWMAATAPFLLLRGSYGVLSSADWHYSYYLPTNVRLDEVKLIPSMARMASTSPSSSLNTSWRSRRKPSPSYCSFGQSG